MLNLLSKSKKITKNTMKYCTIIIICNQNVRNSSKNNRKINLSAMKRKLTHTPASISPDCLIRKIKIKLIKTNNNHNKYLTYSNNNSNRIFLRFVN